MRHFQKMTAAARPGGKISEIFRRRSGTLCQAGQNRKATWRTREAAAAMRRDSSRVERHLPHPLRCPAHTHVQIADVHTRRENVHGTPPLFAKRDRRRRSAAVERDIARPTGTNAGRRGPAGARQAGRNALPHAGTHRRADRAVGLGGYHIGTQADPQESVRIIRAAIDGGITFHGQLLGLQRRPERDPHGQGPPGRLPRKGLPDDQDSTAAPSSSPPGRSTNRCSGLQTDRIDLMQYHEVIRLEDPDRFFADDGAVACPRRRGQSRQDPLRRLHRAQGSAGPLADAAAWPRSAAIASTRCRCRST